MTDKEIFINQLKRRTKKFTVDIIHFCNSLKTCKASSVIEYQLVKCDSSCGANYRAACRARSKPEFFSKICIVVEEADETDYWLDIIKEAGLSNEEDELYRLKNEANELISIMNKAKNTSYHLRDSK